MAIKRPAFTTTRTDEERKTQGYRVLSVRLNANDLRELEEDARLLEQEMPATTLKLLARMGRALLHSELGGLALREYVAAVRRNKRRGISIADPKFRP